MDRQKKLEFREAWGFIMLVLLVATAYFLLHVILRTYPSGPTIPFWVWFLYLLVQLVNRVPVAYDWVNSMIHHGERGLFIFAVFTVIIFAVDPTIYNRIMWIVSSLIISAWIILRFVMTTMLFNRQARTFNKILNAGSDVFVDSPVLVVTLVGIATAE